MGNDTGRPPNSFDVARVAGVSRSTVSRAFTQGAKISPEVRARVFDAANALGYRVNALARGLQARHSNLVGIVASRLDTPFRALQVKSLAQFLMRQGMSPLLLISDGGEDVQALINNLLSYSVAGVIVTSDTPPPEVIEACNRVQVPVVLVNRGVDPAESDAVSMDLDEGGRLAFEMLRDGGATRFGLLAPTRQTYSVSGRAEAFLRHCRVSGHTVTVFESGGQSHRAGFEAAGRMGPELSEIDGLFCATDLLALGTLDGLRGMYGVNVPGQLQVVGFDDIEQASWAAYDLSTIRQDVTEQAMAAVDLVMDRLEEPEKPFQTRISSLEMVHRGTTRRPATD